MRDKHQQDRKWPHALDERDLPPAADLDHDFEISIAVALVQFHLFRKELKVGAVHHRPAELLRSEVDFFFLVAKLYLPLFHFQESVVEKLLQNDALVPNVLENLEVKFFPPLEQKYLKPNLHDLFDSFRVEKVLLHQFLNCSSEIIDQSQLLVLLADAGGAQLIMQLRGHQHFVFVWHNLLPFHAAIEFFAERFPHFQLLLFF